MLWQTVADAVALAALVIAADDISQAKVVRQSDNGQYWIPTVVGAGNPFDLLVTGKGTVTGQTLTWDNINKKWVASVDFGANNPVTTGGFIANSASGFIRLGTAVGIAGSAASVGSIRMARGGGNNATIYGRKNDDSTDVLLWQWDSPSSAGIGRLVIGDLSTLSTGWIILQTAGGASPSAVVLGAGTNAQFTVGTGQISVLINNVVWANSPVTAPLITQELNTAGSGVGMTFSIKAQSCTGATSTGGNFDLAPGAGTTAGGRGRLLSGSAASRVCWNDTGVGFFTVTVPVAQPIMTDNTTGVAANQLVDVGAVPTQANINNNFATVRAKLATLGLVG
jgi:hypothetical protein